MPIETRISCSPQPKSRRNDNRRGCDSSQLREVETGLAIHSTSITFCVRVKERRSATATATDLNEAGSSPELLEVRRVKRVRPKQKDSIVEKSTI